MGMTRAQMGLGGMLAVLIGLSPVSTAWAKPITVAMPEQMTIYLKERNRPIKGLTLDRLDTAQKQIVYRQAGKEFVRNLSDISKIILYGKTTIKGETVLVVQGDGSSGCGSEQRLNRQLVHLQNQQDQRLSIDLADYPDQQTRNALEQSKLPLVLTGMDFTQGNLSQVRLKQCQAR